MGITPLTSTAAREVDRDYDRVTDRAMALVDDPGMTFPVLRDAVLATPALTEFGGNREVATMYLRMTAGEISLAYALARFGLTAAEVTRAASGQDRYCTRYVPIPDDDRKQSCWHPLTDSGACPNAGGHA